MPKRTLMGVLFLVLSFLLVGAAWAQQQAPKQKRQPRQRREVVHPKVGEVLKDFTLKDIEGKEVSLSDFRNKIFVLELGACT